MFDSIALTATEPLDAPPVGWLPRALREPRRPLLAIAVGWAITFFPSLALSTLAHQLFPTLATPDFPMKGVTALFLLVLFAPLGETLIMAGVLTLLLKLVRPVPAILISSAGWGIAHSLEAPAWGLIIWWPFLIFSTLFVAWRPRGFWIAVGLVAAVHALQNLFPALLVAFGA